MSDAELWAAWRLWVVVAALVVVIAAALLVTIIITARRILAEALRAHAAAEVIRQRTTAIWALETTNHVAARILQTVQDIEQKGGALVSALQGQTLGRK